MSICFRVDSDANIGLGHVVRCLALAEMLSGDFSVKFICKNIDDKTAKTIRLSGFDLLRITTDEDLLSLITDRDIVVLDHYGLNSTFQKLIKLQGNKLVCIDDISKDEFFADVIINSAPNITPEYYKAQSFTHYALGPDFALLRPAFLKAAKDSKMIRNTIQSVFVCFGGSDTKNLSGLVAKVLIEDLRFQNINIVVGNEYLFLGKLERMARTDKRVKIFARLGPEQMVLLIKSSDLAIVPASGILTEVIAAGSRIISGIYIGNQKNFFEGYKALGAFESANEFSSEDLKDAINKSFNLRRGSFTPIIDGKSKDRLLKLFKQVTLIETIIFVEADRHHLDITFQWALDSRIRMFSLNTHRITEKEHKSWFLSKIKAPQCYYYLAELNECFIGSIRYDVEGDEAIISYLVDPEYTNQGIGMLLLNIGLEKLKVENPVGLKRISGFVLPQNVASIKAFERLGYKLSLENNMLKYTKFIN